MAVGSGLAASLGVSPEVTYGTYVAPTKFYEVTKPALAKVKNTIQSSGIAAGRLVDLGSRRVVATKAASGSIECEVPNKLFGFLLQHIMGGLVTPVQQAATTAYLQTHQLVDNVGRYMTVQVGVPDLGGTVRPFSFLGAKVTAAEFSCGIDEFLTCKLDIDARDVSEAQGLAAPSYPASVAPFHFGQSTLKIGATAGAAAAVTGVRKMSLKIERPQKTDRFYLGAAGLKAEPIANEKIKISGSIETDFVDKTIFADRYAADTGFAAVWEFVGPVIASTYFETIRFTIPLAFLDSGTPQVEGPDVVAPKFDFVALHDGTNGAVTVEYISTDVTN